MWYYTTPQQLEELLCVLDSNEMETHLVRELLEMKNEILRQMDITERLTNQVKGSRKSYLEIENANIAKQKKLREEQRVPGPSTDLKIEDEKMDNISSIVSDPDVVNEVIVVSEDTNQEENDENQHDTEDDDVKKTKNNSTNKAKTPFKKHEEGKNF